MDFEELKLNEFDWKKWLKVGVGAVIALLIIRMIVMTLFFGEAIKFVSDFNKEFVGGQQAIHNKIEAEQEDFNRRAAAFDKTHESIEKDFQELHEEFEKSWVKQGPALAEQVKEAKDDYEKKLAQCKADTECQKSLTN